MEKNISRRDLMTRTIAGISLATLPEWYAREAWAAEQENATTRTRRIGPNDRINIGCIGPGGSKGGFRQGLGDTRSAQRHPGTQIVAVCDVDQQHCEEAAKVFGSDCKQYHDFRELLANKDVDAVVIGTPDHWHGVVACAAMRAGKDVYCEKPLTLTVDEGKAVVRTQKDTARVFQTGSQQRSDTRFRLACELTRNGRLGKIQRVIAHIPNGQKGGPFPVQPVPAGFDWDFWQGPTQLTAYIPQRTHGNFRYWYEYSGGMMTDWGAHHLDISQWGLGMDDAGPIRVESVGTLPSMWNGYNTAVDFQVTYTYPNDITLLCTHEGENGVQFEGEKGWIFVSRGRIGASDEKLLSEPLPGDAAKLYASNDHMGNWLDSIRSRKETICPAEVGHRSCTVCHIGNISLRLGGRKMDWDPKAQQFRTDADGNRMLSRPMRGPWKV